MAWASPPSVSAWSKSGLRPPRIKVRLITKDIGTSAARRAGRDALSDPVGEVADPAQVADVDEVGDHRGAVPAGDREVRPAVAGLAVAEAVDEAVVVRVDDHRVVAAGLGLRRHGVLGAGDEPHGKVPGTLGHPLGEGTRVFARVPSSHRLEGVARLSGGGRAELGVFHPDDVDEVHGEPRVRL